MCADRPTAKKLPQHRFTFLLVALVFLLIVAPLLQGTPLHGALYAMGITAVLITGLVANRGQKWVFRTGLFVAIAAIPVCWAATFTGPNALDLSEYLIITLFCGVTAAVILIAVIRDYMATAQAVIGAICVYLLIGLTWAMVYSTIEYIQDDAFKSPAYDRQATVGEDRPSFSDMVYFSFSTMTTLGYGDITPRTELAKMASVLQAIVGVFYMAVIVARLVSAMSMRKPDGGN
jgi:hypothetical protein